MSRISWLSGFSDAAVHARMSEVREQAERALEAARPFVHACGLEGSRIFCADGAVMRPGIAVEYRKCQRGYGHAILHSVGEHGPV